MHPELSVKGLPFFGKPRPHIPNLSKKDGVLVEGVSRTQGGLVFRAHGNITAGIWLEEDGQKAQLLLEDSDHLWFDPKMVGPNQDVLAVRGMPPSGAPSFTHQLAFVHATQGAVRISGQSVGFSGNGQVALVADVVQKKLRRVDLGDLTAEDICAMEGGMDPQLAPLVALDERGEEALFMDAQQERCDASLQGLNLATGQISQLWERLPAPSLVWGAFIPNEGGVLLTECRLGQAPQSRILHLSPKGAREILSLPASQPASLPVFIDDDTAVALLSLKSHPMATYGPVDVVLFSLTGNAQKALTQKGDLNGALRLQGKSLWVEGGQVAWELERRS